jgi:16S rRNA (guanine527-N7)-methyltransferase
VFPVDRLELAVAYAELLADAGVVRGLIGPREVPRLWERHLLNCAVVAEAVPPSVSLADIGSGAGLPGLVLAIARPDVSVTLVEPLLRRTIFLEEAVAHLGLDNVVVRRGRAEDVAGSPRFDVVTSRAVAPLDRLLRWSMPLVAPGGVALAMKGSSAAEEIEGHRATWRALGCAAPEVITVGQSTGVSTATLVRVAWADPARVSSDLARPASRSRPRRARSTDRKPPR